VISRSLAYPGRCRTTLNACGRSRVANQFTLTGYQAVVRPMPEKRARASDVRSTAAVALRATVRHSSTTSRIRGNDPKQPVGSGGCSHWPGSLWRRPVPPKRPPNKPASVTPAPPSVDDGLDGSSGKCVVNQSRLDARNQRLCFVVGVYCWSSSEVQPASASNLSREGTIRLESALPCSYCATRCRAMASNAGLAAARATARSTW
jgi:hypothetical protein